ncbi:TetR family transcriptional regulator [Actinomycetospora sp. C-140]
MVATIGTAGDGRRLPRQARSQATHRALLTAAGERFAAQGFHGTALSELVGDGAATKGAFYFHFSSKQAVAEALVAAMTDSWDAVTDAVTAAGRDGLEALVLLTDAVTVRLDDPVVRGAGRVLRDGVVASPTLAEIAGWWRDQAEDLLEQAQRAGFLRPEADPAWVARELVAGFAGRATVNEAPGSAEALWDLMNDFWAGLLPLIATAEWRARWDARPWARRPRPVGVGPGDAEHLVVRPIGEPSPAP